MPSAASSGKAPVGIAPMFKVFGAAFAELHDGALAELLISIWSVVSLSILIFVLIHALIASSLPPA